MSFISLKYFLVGYIWCIILPHYLQSKPSVNYSSASKNWTKSKLFSANDFKRKPVLMVPGILGSRIEGKLNNPNSPFYCKKKTSDFISLWLNIEYLLPFEVDCWVDNMKMVYNNITRVSKNCRGVETRVPDFGGTSAFEYLDENKYAPGSKYFAPLVEYMVNNLGYTRRKDLAGAPFDWRLAPSTNEFLRPPIDQLCVVPDQQDNYFKNLASLTEKVYYTNGNKKVVLFGHSLGNMFLYYFLHNQPDSWKQKFVDSFVSVSGPYQGAVKTLKALTSGETEGHDLVVPKLKVREVVRTAPAFPFVLPNPDFWPKDKQLLVVTLTRNYTVLDYEALFQRIKCPWCWDMWKDNGKAMGTLQAPSVPVHCIYGSGTPTPETLVYDETLFPDDSPSLVDGSGDGTVNIWSGSACLKWKNQQKQPVYGFDMPGNSHVHILWNATLHKYLSGVFKQ